MAKPSSFEEVCLKTQNLYEILFFINVTGVTCIILIFKINTGSNTQAIEDHVLKTSKHCSGDTQITKKRVSK